MKWYRARWWRFALSQSRAVKVYDAKGTWWHVVGPLWVRVDGPEEERD